MTRELVSIIDVPKHIGEEVTIGAWVANKSGKGKIAFLQLRDGSAFFQGVAFKPNFLEKFGEEAGLEKFFGLPHAFLKEVVNDKTQKMLFE